MEMNEMNESEQLNRHQCLKGDVHIIVQKVQVEGHGVILLTGPSSCGKGEIAKALCKFLSIPEERHLSMGSILRMTIDKARSSEDFKNQLANEYKISDKLSIFDPSHNRPSIIAKAEGYREDILNHLKKKNEFISQLDWLEYCVTRGLLVPDEWTESIINAVFRNSPELQKEIFILDGYPRTVTAAEHLLRVFKELNIPIIKVLHLAITKEQMKIRALNRKRADDTEESLERRYQFYVDKVQPCTDYLKYCLGSSVVLIDAHQPVFDEVGKINVESSIHQVVLNVMQALGLPRFLLDIEE